LALALLLALLAALPSPRALAADGALDLRNLILDNQAGDITVRFGVGVPELHGLEEELAAGTTVGLKCRAVVYRHKSLWTDTNVAETSFVSPLRKDALANDYILEIPASPGPCAARTWGPCWPRAGAPGPGSRPMGKPAARPPVPPAHGNFHGPLEVPVWMRYVVFFLSFDLFRP
jgi:hypothetical protein